MKKKNLTTLLFIILHLLCYGQTYLPVSVYSPQLDETNKIQTEIGINNFGLNYSFGLRLNKVVTAIHYEYSNGRINIDPLNFDKYKLNRFEASSIQSYLAKHNYLELIIGYKLKSTKQKLSTYMGLGNHLNSKKWRYFIQIDWGNQSKIIDAGISLRGSYSKASSLDIFNPQTLIAHPIYVLTPSIYGKLKIWKLYIKNQFGYAVNLNKNEDYMQPIITFGIGYKY